jgi:hypothetical protein
VLGLLRTILVPSSAVSVCNQGGPDERKALDTVAVEFLCCGELICNGQKLGDESLGAKNRHILYVDLGAAARERKVVARRQRQIQGSAYTANASEAVTWHLH